jgi:hypothetical protein
MAAAEPPTPLAAILYVDTSALLKLLVREAESTAIERELLTWEFSRPASSPRSSCQVHVSALDAIDHS